MGVAQKIGLTDGLADLPVEIGNFSHPKIIRMSSGGWIAISRVALESDLILNLPKLKAHHQMRVTGAVKNIYGCATGPFKPLFHSNGFRTPDHLFPVSFRPLKVATHLYKKFMKSPAY